MPSHWSIDARAAANIYATRLPHLARVAYTRRAARPPAMLPALLLPLLAAAGPGLRLATLWNNGPAGGSFGDQLQCVRAACADEGGAWAPVHMWLTVQLGGARWGEVLTYNALGNATAYVLRPGINVLCPNNLPDWQERGMYDWGACCPGSILGGCHALGG